MLNKPVTITLDKERTLRLTLKGMLEFEKITGLSLLKGFRLDAISLTESAALMWACLIHEDKDLTFEDVTAMVDIDNFADALTAVKQCIDNSVTKEKADKPPLVKRPQAG